MKLTTQPIPIDVIAKGTGTAVVTLADRRAPMLLLRRDVVTRLQNSAEAAILRIRAGVPDAEAVQTFLDALKAATDQYEVECERFTNQIWDTHGEDTETIGREFEGEMDALKRLWPDGGGPVT
jgi:hypothetical protein